MDDANQDSDDDGDDQEESKDAAAKYDSADPHDNLELSEDQWKELGKRIIERKLTKQFDKTISYADRRKCLEKYLLLQIYTYGEKDQFYVWKQKFTAKNRVWVKQPSCSLRESAELAFCESIHFNRIKYLRKFFTTTNVKPSNMKNCLYYAILILPVQHEYRDQGYVGKVGGGDKNSVAARWTNHNGGDLIVDQNLRLMQQYFGEKLHQYAAIFVLVDEKNDQKDELLSKNLNASSCTVISAQNMERGHSNVKNIQKI